MTRFEIASAGVLAVALSSMAGLGCGGASKPADAPGSCPEGTVLRGTDCVPPEAANEAPKEAASTSDAPASAPASGSSDSAAAAKTPYDRDAVEAELKRGARQVKANCGAATDDDGQATGPWGHTKATIVLGRNGHVRQVTVPPPFDGKPVGVCVIHAFDKIWFPPYAYSTDVSVDWDVDVVQPKK